MLVIHLEKEERAWYPEMNSKSKDKMQQESSIQKNVLDHVHFQEITEIMGGACWTPHFPGNGVLSHFKWILKERLAT